MSASRDLKPGEPCDHRGCLAHVSHPCEGCGRIAGQGWVFAQQYECEFWDDLAAPPILKSGEAR